MTAADFTIDYFKLCLSQHVWGWRDLTNAFDRQKHSASEDFSFTSHTPTDRRSLTPSTRPSRSRLSRST